ncbi:HpcH/HpaI aldolase/citrate lyase family protein [Arthrobacter sp. NPDC055585]
MTPQPALPRSFLYVPGNQPGLFPKAAAGAADAVILDLEDAVPAAEKESARSAVGRWLAAEDAAAGPQWWVRAAPENLEQDLTSVASEHLSGVVLAKCSTAGLQHAEELVRKLEDAGRLIPGAVRLIGLLEDAGALLEAEAIPQLGRLATYGIGEVDLLADLRIARLPETDGAIDSLRTRVVVACAAAGLAAPLAPTSTDFRDLEAFEHSAVHLRSLGFRSRTAIHPGQVPVINSVFTPDETDIQAARELLERFTGAGSGVAVDAEGRFIDAAVVRAAQETLDRA